MIMPARRNGFFPSPNARVVFLFLSPACVATGLCLRALLPSIDLQYRRELAGKILFFLMDLIRLPLLSFLAVGGALGAPSRRAGIRFGGGFRRPDFLLSESKVILRMFFFLFNFSLLFHHYSFPRRAEVALLRRNAPSSSPPSPFPAEERDVHASFSFSLQLDGLSMNSFF